MNIPSSGLAQSVQTRLVRHARVLGVDPNLVLARFAAERFLYRLSCSQYAGRFVLKGGLMLIVWFGEQIRPTRDADLLGLGDLSAEALAATFREVCAIEVKPDGLTYDPATIRVAAIRPEDIYGGQRISLQARLGPARLRVQVDVGIGDDVTPEPEWIEYPSLLDLPRPRLRAYCPETAIAEKVHAMVVLGMKNSRMRDFFDIHALAERKSFDGNRISRALRATFDRRRTPIPQNLPTALTPAFAAAEDKRSQWRGFLGRNGITAGPEGLEHVIAKLSQFLAPVLATASQAIAFSSIWPIGGPWQPVPSPGEKGKADT
jgi:predicted nucleotidyltransferase component of viral defense system